MPTALVLAGGVAVAWSVLMIYLVCSWIFSLPLLLLALLTRGRDRGFWQPVVIWLGLLPPAQGWEPVEIDDLNGDLTLATVILGGILGAPKAFYLVAFLLLFWRGMRAALGAPDRFGHGFRLGDLRSEVIQEPARFFGYFRARRHGHGGDDHDHP